MPVISCVLCVYYIYIFNISCVISILSVVLKAFGVRSGCVLGCM